MSQATRAPLAGDRWAAARAAEAHYLRMCRLRRMDTPSCAACSLAGPSQIAPWLESAARYGIVRGAGARWARCCSTAPAWRGTRRRRWPGSLGAAEAGSPEAMNMAGRCHRERLGGAGRPAAAAPAGTGAPPRPGYDWGEYNYANMLFDGRGVACDRRGGRRLVPPRRRAGPRAGDEPVGALL